MENLFIEYPKCSTCKKAKKWLETNNILFEDRNIIENNPTEKELKDWINKSGKEIKRWFNTSGLKYKSLNLNVENLFCRPLVNSFSVSINLLRSTKILICPINSLSGE